jgi:hypothetical protein
MSPFDLKIVDQPTLSTIDSEIDHGQDTLTIINDVVDQTELSVDKKQLKVIFEQLYKQSLSLET